MLNNVSDTFWNRLRIKSGVSLNSMAKSLGMDISYLSKCLTGAKLPPTPSAVKICDYFGIDYIVGAEEFNKAHEAWIASHPGNRKNRSHIRKRKFNTECVPVSPAPVVESVSEATLPKKSDPKPEDTLLAKALYNKLSFEDFISVVYGNLPMDEIQKVVYGKLDFDTYYSLFYATIFS